MNSENQAVEERTWSKPKLIDSAFLRWTITFLVIIYIIFAVRSFEINVDRIIRGLDRAWEMLYAFLQPDFLARQSHIFQGVLESITMTVVATSLGILFAIPVTLGAAKNISPLPVYYFCRGILVVFRSLHVVILAILFVIMFGFGPFAGVLTMIINSIGFIGKLLSEDIENISDETLEAIRATGASWPQLIIYGVWPQVSSRFIGLSIYRADMTFRQSTVIGLVGAGGIGAVLDTAMGRYDFNTAAAILIVIIILVLIGEYVSSAIRRRLT
ncbi:phosphonate ABC transporter, permease protein PhnE [Halanaerobium sp. Z-7514]|uniref:Phosphonate ABC transporter, permease protein PhnE n=1 Tax=Halanaerobium polyolivorans TaxID=2886943 RepID=A0AAW4WX68_9FIRM|nr:phosphonate ABC transporter, permease protein PhnE [Halanaerobium polyolivorans]MCC3144473.1 phosphonate ABC transporter, permease protein PhnE [Halanaerobium polyolivorans]RQD77035.1 MAG: phosphonate ABC transporter, permease protein PhnE [Halanaerobium sp. MSAO_Bac5]